MVIVISVTIQQPPRNLNTDETAPIFGICDAGLIGDLHEVVPELTRRIREAHGEPSPA